MRICKTDCKEPGRGRIPIKEYGARPLAWRTRLADSTARIQEALYSIKGQPLGMSRLEAAAAVLAYTAVGAIALGLAVVLQ